MSTCTSVLPFIPIPFCLLFFRFLEPPLLSDASFFLVLIFSFRRWVNASLCLRVRVRRHEFGASVEAQPCTMCLLGSRPPSVSHPSRSIAFVGPTLEKGGRGGKTRKVQRGGAACGEKTHIDSPVRCHVAEDGLSSPALSSRYRPCSGHATHHTIARLRERSFSFFLV